MQRLVAYMNIGLPESRTDDPFARLWNALTVGIAQTKNPSRPGHRGDARDDLLGVHGADGGTVETVAQGACRTAGFITSCPSRRSSSGAP